MILDLPLSSISKFLNHAIESEKEKATWELWKSMYPNMAIGLQKFISFNDFKAKVNQKELQTTRITTKEIIDEMTEIRKKLG